MDFKREFFNGSFRCFSSHSESFIFNIFKGFTFFFYVWDLLGRVVPDLKDTLFLTPFSYANASDVFSTGEVEWKAFVVGTIVLLGAVIGSFIVYEKKDLAV